MDPITIFGLISNIISVIDSSVQVVSAAKALRRSTHGASRSAQDLEALLREANDLLSDSVLGVEQCCEKRLSTSEKKIGMVILGEECQDMAKEVEKWTHKLTVSEGSLRAWRIMKVAGLELARKDDIDRLKGRLDALRSKLTDRARQVLYEDNHSEIVTRLKKIEESQQQHRMESNSTLASIRDDIFRLIQRQTDANGDDEIEHALGASRLLSLQRKLEVFERERGVYEKQRKFLKSLHFQDFKHRRSHIVEAVTSTNAWLYDPEEKSFVKWLETGGGFFLISGKAGSGKSTLMKFAAEHETTIASLKKWADPLELHSASFYFWNSGSVMEKSRVGLLQSLLYQMFRNSATLASGIVLNHPRHEQWDIKDLKDLFKMVMESTSLSSKYYFFVDGLDEYEGHEEDLVDILQFISCSAHVKICASSRPRCIIEDSLAVPEYMVIIHEHTAKDIDNYIRQVLSQNDKFRGQATQQSAYWNLVSMISSASQGVWLWVYLVTRELIRAVNRHESLPKLLERNRESDSDRSRQVFRSHYLWRRTHI